MTGTRLPVRQVVIVDGDDASKCDPYCDYLHYTEEKHILSCGLNDAKDVERITGRQRTEACKAATAPRSCNGCVHAGDELPLNVLGTVLWCRKYTRPVSGWGGTAEPLMQCDGPEVAT